MKSFWSKAGDPTTATSWFKGVADDAASKIRQQREAFLAPSKPSAAQEDQERLPAPLPSIKEPPKKDQQFLRLPVESAKKLRFFDNAELDAIIAAHVKEKESLYSTCSALQQVLESAGVGKDSVDSEVAQLLSDKECLRAYDDAVNGTLLVSAQEEVRNLRASGEELRRQLAAIQAEKDSIEERLRTAQTASAATGTARREPIEVRDRTQVQLSLEAGDDGEERVAVTILAQGTLYEPEGDADGGGEADALAELQGEVASLRTSLEEEQSRNSALMRKLARMEEEKRDLVESREGPGREDGGAARVAELERQLVASQEACRAAEQEAEERQLRLKSLEDESDRKIAELRAKVTQAGHQQSEMLRRAQDICMEAEERADVAERKTAKAEGRVMQLENEMRESRSRIRELEKELKRSEKEREKAEARADNAENAVTEASLKGHVEAQAGATVRGHLASVRRAAEEKEAELRRTIAENEAAAEEEIGRLKDRIAELEDEVGSLTAQLSRAQAEVQSWERRLREADEREAGLLSDLQEAEAVVAERDLLSARVTALEDKLSDSRMEKGQIDHYKQVAHELENARVRAEEELMATARIVTSLEGRLRASNREAEDCRHAMEAAEKRVMELERRMEEEVRAQLKACGAERSRWPFEAQAEVERLENKVAAVQQMLSTVQEQLESESKARQADSRHAALMRKRANELETEARRVERDTAERIRVLERDLRAARDEADECRRIVSEVEEERMALQEKLKPQVKDENGLFRNRGGGSLYGAADEEMAAEGKGDEAQRPELKGVDIVYLKNVILKFIEAAVRNNSAQRDALLPAIATLVQATPQEFKAIQAAITESEQESSAWYTYFGSGPRQ